MEAQEETWDHFTWIEGRPTPSGEGWHFECICGETSPDERLRFAEFWRWLHETGGDGLPGTFAKEPPPPEGHPRTEEPSWPRVY